MSWTIYRQPYVIGEQGYFRAEDAEHVLAFDGHGQALLWCAIKPNLERKELELLDCETMDAYGGVEALYKLFEDLKTKHDNIH